MRAGVTFLPKRLTKDPRTDSNGFFMHFIMAKRVFTGVFIPAKIWENKKLTPVKKMLLAEISVLSEDTGFCYAGNPHFAEWLECSPQNISKHIRELKEMGAITITFENQLTGEGRKMYVKKEFYYGPDPLTPGLAPLTPGLAPLTPGLAERQFKDNLKDIHIKPQKVETADEARTAINAWLNDGNEETVKLWYSELKINYNRVEFKTVLIKFCSNYMTSSDEGFVQRFQKDPVKFFRNRFQIFLPTCRGFDAKQSTKPAPSQSRAVYTPPAKRF